VLVVGGGAALKPKGKGKNISLPINTSGKKRDGEFSNQGGRGRGGTNSSILSKKKEKGERADAEQLICHQKQEREGSAFLAGVEKKRRRRSRGDTSQKKGGT